MKIGIGILNSSHGVVTYNAETGEVVQDSNDGCDQCWRSVPVHVELGEWRATYPGEEPEAEEHDILDFGIWWREMGQGTVTIEFQSADMDWRREWREEAKHGAVGKG